MQQLQAPAVHRGDLQAPLSGAECGDDAGPQLLRLAARAGQHNQLRQGDTLLHPSCDGGNQGGCLATRRPTHHAKRGTLQRGLCHHQALRGSKRAGLADRSRGTQGGGLGTDHEIHGTMTV